MNINALFDALPEAPWVTGVVAAVIVLFVADQVIKTYTTVLDRRSDNLLLQQAEKAASIFEKLPEGHRSRSEILTYISQGPVADLAVRHATRANRKRDAKARRRRNMYVAITLVVLTIFIMPDVPKFYASMIAQRSESNPIASSVGLILIATSMVLAVYLVSFLIAFPIIAIILRLVEVVTELPERIWLRFVEKRKERKGKGGVYEI